MDEKDVRATRFPEDTRFVTARELGRRTGALLDAVAEGTRLVVTRGGLPLAVVEPSEGTALLGRARKVARDRAALEAVEDPQPAKPFDLLSLDVDGYVLVVLESVERVKHHDGVIRDTGLHVSQTGAALGLLEIRGLIERVAGGFGVTDRGWEAVTAWRALSEQEKQAVAAELDRARAAGRD